MRLILACISLCLALPSLAADLAREKKWADEILPSVLVGDPVWLEQADGHKFLALYATANHHPRAALILVHGIGVHPDWGFISTLRQKLPEADLTTLSIQMPILAASAKRDDYPPEFDRAAQRLARAVAFLKAKGYQRIAILSHSLGGPMTYRYLSGKPDPAVKAWISIATPGDEDYAKLTLPILDVYGENDSPEVMRGVPVRAKALRHPASTQIQIAKADHFFNGQEDFLIKVVAKYIDRQLGN